MCFNTIENKLTFDFDNSWVKCNQTSIDSNDDFKCNNDYEFWLQFLPVVSVWFNGILSVKLNLKG